MIDGSHAIKLVLLDVMTTALMAAAEKCRLLSLDDTVFRQAAASLMRDRVETMARMGAVVQATPEETAKIKG